MLNDAPTLMVYEFEYRDGVSGIWLRSPVPATIEAIASNGWKAIPGSARPILSELVAKNGVALRKPD
jgi:hypothetical protein